MANRNCPMSYRSFTLALTLLQLILLATPVRADPQLEVNGDILDGRFQNARLDDRVVPRSPQPTPDVATTTFNYVVQFYPRWFTYQQANLVPPNKFIGPASMGPLYGIVVAPNDDTLYASSLMDLTSQPEILTIPATTVSHSLLTLDLYGNIFNTGIKLGVGGTYGLTGPGWTRTLPPGVTQIKVPFNFTEWIIRADKFARGEDETTEAEAFRASLRTAPLSDYLNDPSIGATTIYPLAFFAIRYRVLADVLIATDPIAFLKQIQMAVADPDTPPLSLADQALVNQFNSLFGDGRKQTAAFSAATQAADVAILAHYQGNAGPTNWITFSDIGTWGTKYLDRAATTAFIQYGNDRITAAYYHAFQDGSGNPLDGSTSDYVLTFPAGQIPQARRFWSVTAYLPESITLVPNSADKYVVASYTPGLVTNPDGSISIYMARTLPAGIPTSNWLPIPGGKFNLLLRVYGPEGSVAADTYVPPGISTFVP
jgi:hypothetical protein